jgi:hypothetical protein
MGLGMNLFHTLVPFSNLFTKSKPKKDPYADFMAQIKPYLDRSQAVSDESFSLAKTNLETGNNLLNIPADFYKRIMSGNFSMNELSSYFSNPDITKNQDENQQIVEEFGVRGGRRAADLTNTQTNRESALNKAYQEIKSRAPDALGSIGQAFSGLGASLLNPALAGNSVGLESMFNIEGFNQADKQRKSDMIASIIGSIGSVAGFLACVTGDTKILTSMGEVMISDLMAVEDITEIKVKACRNGELNRLVSLPIISIRETPNKAVFEVETKSGYKMTCTNNHFIVTANEPYIEKPINTLTLDDKAIILQHGRLIEDPIKSITPIGHNMVYMIKVADDETIIYL